MLKELRELLKKTGDLEQKQKQGKTDVSKELEEIDRQHGELDDLVADAIAKMNESRRPQVAPPPQKVAPPPPSSGKQPPQLGRGQDYNKAHAFDYKYREPTSEIPKEAPRSSWTDMNPANGLSRARTNSSARFPSTRRGPTSRSSPTNTPREG